MRGGPDLLPAAIDEILRLHAPLISNRRVTTRAVVVGAGYGVKFGKNNQNERATMMGMQWQDGKLVTVYPENAAIAKMRFKK
ncbi:hypothetical protein H721_02421 [Brucella ovis IntaBari-2006-46-332]|uniref:hypothetical protein n=1 Tax=Brucella ovis TaxID=236 RepID=UPI0002CE09CE|nr:hypothetical protein C010_02587 [Brucella ovis 80/125]ENR06676.1 hypothetical protein C961_02297 [Brucella ovis F8/05B]ENS93308.1 hypothetical protein B999_02563 [Brucella ovis 63/96]ENS97773.1 hypothetical protein C009_02436 [Brucella ovis 81/8]ENT76108.1 hypothetical protein H712_02566 [Brucella ovis IntaBari-2009-88-4]ENT78351.1 hypothetical protein H720_02357 [Brucella ovis IntaBari-2006-46-348]ENT81900.1 hypothetical protein H713_02569 [Brucella ovis IntaBari-2010-47-268]ENT86492.1 h